MERVNKILEQFGENSKSFIERSEDKSLHSFRKLKKAEESPNFEPIPRHGGAFAAGGFVVGVLSGLADATKTCFLATNPELKTQQCQEIGRRTLKGAECGAAVGSIVGMTIGLLDVYVKQSTRMRKKLKKESDQLLKKRSKKVELRRSKKVTPIALPVPSQLQTDYSRVVGAPDVGLFL